MDFVKLRVESALGGSGGRLGEGAEVLVSGHESCAIVVLDRHMNIAMEMCVIVSLPPRLIILPNQEKTHVRCCLCVCDFSRGENGHRFRGLVRRHVEDVGGISVRSERATKFVANEQQPSVTQYMQNESCKHDFHKDT